MEDFLLSPFSPPGTSIFCKKQVLLAGARSLLYWDTPSANLGHPTPQRSSVRRGNGSTSRNGDKTLGLVLNRWMNRYGAFQIKRSRSADDTHWKQRHVLQGRGLRSSSIYPLLPPPCRQAGHCAPRNAACSARHITTLEWRRRGAPDSLPIPPPSHPHAHPDIIGKQLSTENSGDDNAANLILSTSVSFNSLPGQN